MRRSMVPGTLVMLVLGAVVPSTLAATATGREGEADPFPPPLRAPRIESVVEPAVPLGGPSFEERVLEIVNQERLANGGLPPLKGASELDSSSETHSTNMAERDFFAHCDLDTGTSPGDRMTAAGYIWASAAENIAAGYSTPEAVMAAWMASSGHMASILTTSRREIGVGYYLQGDDQNDVRLDQIPTIPDCVADGTDGPYFHYWTQNFGRRLTSVVNEYPLVIEREAYQTTSQTVDLYVYEPPGATQIRFSNDGVTWSALEPFSTTKTWTLSSGDGLKTVYSEVEGDLIYLGEDSITLFLGDEVFSDGFESGDVSVWSAASP